MDTGTRTVADRYRLQEVVGRGGMSTVYRATDQVLGRTVAVKVLLAVLAEQDPTYAARFRREARAAAALTSPALVTVYDTGIDEDGAQYLVMEYVSGHSLAELLAEERPLAVPEAVRIAHGVADALRAAHRAGILHRDIKPANVMIADDGSVKVLDFGIARRLDGTTLTQTASVVGTAAYMAPERALGKPGDARSDVYSLGCLLYAMLTGRPPFTGEVAAALLHQQVNSVPRPPSRLRAGIPAALDALVLQTLAKEPEARPQAAEEVRDRLLALTGRPQGAAAAGAAATTAIGPAATAPTAVLARPRRTRVRLAAVLADHRSRAVVMAVATALVALLAVAVLAAGGGANHPKITGQGSARGNTTTVRSSSRTPTRKQKPAKPAKAKPTGPAGSPGHGGKPPGHGGQPPGQGGQPPGQGDGGDQGD